MNLLNIKNKAYTVLKAALFVFILTGLSTCTEENPLPQREWQLTWSDEFDGAAGQLPDAASWNFDIGTGWGNEQLEYDTDRAENASMDGNGNLAIVARAESFAGSAYTSARITTYNKFEQEYGRFEARIQLPYGPGLWPAFWLLGDNIDEVGWPQCGEIDIMEFRGQEPNIIHGSVHGPGYSAGAAITKKFITTDSRFDTEFHIYAIEWGVDYIDYYIDDILYFRVRPDDVTGEWVYDHPFFIILNVAVGGTFVGFPAPGTEFPQTMLVDYVRVYRQVNN